MLPLKRLPLKSPPRFPVPSQDEVGICMPWSNVKSDFVWRYAPAVPVSRKDCYAFEASLIYKARCLNKNKQNSDTNYFFTYVFTEYSAVGFILWSSQVFGIMLSQRSLPFFVRERNNTPPPHTHTSLLLRGYHQPNTPSYGDMPKN